MVSEAPTPEAEAPDSQFTKTLPGLQFAWDQTSLSELRLCPRRYYYRIIRGLQSKNEKPPLTFGSTYHTALEIYHGQRAKGVSWRDALHAALDYAIMEAQKWPDWSRDDLGIKPDKIRDINSLVRGIVWYADHFKKDPAQTLTGANGEPLVELSFRFELPVKTHEGEPFIAAGHIDRMIKFGEATYAQEHKHTVVAVSQYYWNRYSPDPQVSMYTLASRTVLPEQCSGVMIDAAQFKKASVHFHRQVVRRTKAQTDEWLTYFIMDLQELRDRLQRLADAGIDSTSVKAWPMNDKACSLFGGCPFQKVCQQDPSIRETTLKFDYDTHHWNPLDNR